MRKFVTAFVLFPLLILFVMFAVANREAITISLDPFDSVQPALSFKLPLFLLIVGLFASGLLLGGLITWIRQRKWRARARRAEAEAARLCTELVARSAMPPQGAQAALPQPPVIYPPAA